MLSEALFIPLELCVGNKIHIFFRGRYKWDFQWFQFCFYYFVVSKNQRLKAKLRVFKNKLLWTGNLERWISLSAVLYTLLSHDAPVASPIIHVHTFTRVNTISRISWKSDLLMRGIILYILCNTMWLLGSIWY